jgi:hypothetical protein
MANQAVTFRLNSHTYFIPALRQYALLSKRTPAEVVNKKGFYIMRRAIWHTHKSDYQTMANQLGQLLTLKSRKFRGKKGVARPTARGQGQFNSASTAPAPLLALIINARRGRKGLKGLFGPAMKKAFQRVFGARGRSIAFIKSGWIQARELFKAAGGGGGKGLPPSEGTSIGGPKQLGRPKGGATVARPGWRAKAIFWNSATTKRDHKQSLYKYGIPALKRAIDEETQDTMEEVARRLRQNAKQVGIRVR